MGVGCVALLASWSPASPHLASSYARAGGLWLMLTLLANACRACKSDLQRGMSVAYTARSRYVYIRMGQFRLNCGYWQFLETIARRLDSPRSVQQQETHTYIDRSRNRPSTVEVAAKVGHAADETSGWIAGAS